MANPIYEMNRNYRNMNGLRFLMLIFGLMMIVNVRQVRPDDETSEEEFDDDPAFLSGGGSAVGSSSSSSSEEDDTYNNNKGIEFYLNAMKDLHRQSKRQEAEPASRSGATAPIAALYRRSALNKNFIRFGRSGGGMGKTVSHQLQQPTQPIRLMGLNESDSKDEERSFHPVRPSRSLRSNFIRFGRSFFPTSNRWGETVRRFARTPSAGRHMMSLVDLPVSSSVSRR